MNRFFSVTRWWGIVLKEFIQLRRDRITFGMIVGLPILQLALFGYAINTDPKQQWIGNLLPLTYFNRLVRGILLKSNGWVDLWPSVWPVAIFTVIVMTIAVRFYRRTLD